MEDFKFKGIGNIAEIEELSYQDFTSCTSVSETMIASMVYTMNNVYDRSSATYDYTFKITTALYNALKASTYYTGTDTQYDTFRSVMNNQNHYKVVAQ